MTAAASRPPGVVVAIAALIGTLAGCSGSPTDPLGLAGCLEGDTGTIAIGVANNSGEAIVIEGVELTESSGVEIIDRFIAIDEDARSTAVRFTDGGRETASGVDLDQLAIEPDAAAFVGVEVARTGSADGRVGGLVITVDGAEQSAPVTLDLSDSCE
ncbi:hypothetical protein [Microcella sp.]|uniref:hypothetical protein n=1 Tax=Microcella sp. TaxID=1913979 RepID=UPI003F6FEDED